MEISDYKKRFIQYLIDSGSFFIGKDLTLKDGRPTPYFINLGMFHHGESLSFLAQCFAEMLVENQVVDAVDVILGPSYKGSALACATSMKLYSSFAINKAFDYDRILPKQHGEASSKRANFVNQAFFDGCRILIVDDVVTSMSTKQDIIDKVNMEAERNQYVYAISGIAVLVNRQQLPLETTTDPSDSTQRMDAARLFTQSTGISVHSLVTISEILYYAYSQKIPILHKDKGQEIKPSRRCIDEPEWKWILDYLQTYCQVDF